MWPFDVATNKKIDQVLITLGLLERRMESLMASLEQILDSVTQQHTMIASVTELINGLKKQLAEALSGVLTPEQQAKVDAIFSTVEDNTADIAAALNANT